MTESTRLNESVSQISMMHRPFGAPRIHMDENASGGAAPTPHQASEAPAEFSSPSSAATYWAGIRNKRPAEQAEADGENNNTPDPGAAEAAADPGDDELSDEGSAAPGEDNQAPGEDQDSDPAEKQPPIARPKSWAKEDQAEWDGLPRPLQEKIAAREDTREKAIRKGQNEAAEKLKGLTAKEQAAEQARANYEAQVKTALAVLEREQLRDFADIRSPADVTRLAETDPIRFNLWQAHQAEIAWASEQAKAAEQRAEKAKSDEWLSYRSKENTLAIEHIPDLGDQAKATKVMEKAVSLLQEVGFSPEDLGRYDSGEKLSLFDHRIQRVLYDAIRFRDMMAAKAVAVKKPVPPVQRPGSKPSGGGADAERIRTLTNRFQQTGDLRDAVALRQARIASSRRRAS